MNKPLYRRFSPFKSLPLNTALPLLVTAFFINAPALADETDSIKFEQCLVKAILAADNNASAGDLRANCKAELASQVDTTVNVQAGNESADTRQQAATAEKLDPFTARRQAEANTQEQAFVMTPHRQNYLMFATYTDEVNNVPYEAAFPDEPGLENTEAMFQISFKFPIWTQMLGSNANMYVAYTQRSFWQVYNSEISAPFRENNFEPEAFVSFNTDWNIGGGWYNSINKIGIDHQSNGQREILSRSWNRIYAETFLINPEYNIFLSLKPWMVVGNTDDNPDITDYMGNFEFKAVYNLEKPKQNFGLMLRNNLDSDNKGALLLDWSFPFYKRLRGYVQGFSGYGYSLIDYDVKQNVIGVGFELTDYL